MTDKTFPVLWQGTRDLMRRLEALGCPRTVPWAFIADHGVQCFHNHDQCPEVLASRGGLAPEEMLAVIHGGTLTFRGKRSYWRMPPEQSVPRLQEALRVWNAEHPERSVVADSTKPLRPLADETPEETEMSDDIRTEARSLLEGLPSWGDGPNWCDPSGHTIPIPKVTLRRLLNYILTDVEALLTLRRAGAQLHDVLAAVEPEVRWTHGQIRAIRQALETWEAAVAPDAPDAPPLRPSK